MNSPCYFYIVYLNTNSFTIVYSKPCTTKVKAIEKASTYVQTCIIYNAVNQTYLTDSRHKERDRHLISVLFRWAKLCIPNKNLLETIPEEEEVEEEVMY
jgi:hypothetical protein